MVEYCDLDKEFDNETENLRRRSMIEINHERIKNLRKKICESQKEIAKCQKEIANYESMKPATITGREIRECNNVILERWHWD